MAKHENLEWVNDGKVLAGAFAFINFKIDKNEFYESIKLAKNLIDKELKIINSTASMKTRTAFIKKIDKEIEKHNIKYPNKKIEISKIKIRPVKLNQNVGIIYNAIIRSMRGLEKNKLRKLFFENHHIPNIKYKEEFKWFLEESNLFEVFTLIMIANLLFKKYSPEEAAFLALYSIKKYKFRTAHEEFGKNIKFTDFINRVIDDKYYKSAFGEPGICKPYLPVFIAIKLLRLINNNKMGDKQACQKIKRKYNDIEKTAQELILDFNKIWSNVVKKIEEVQGWRID